MTTFIDTLEETDITALQDDLTPEERARWEAIIERDLRERAEGKPINYLTLDEFEKKLIDAAHKLYA